MESENVRLRQNLETKFDLPFIVKQEQENHDPVFIIIPQNNINNIENLFEIRLKTRQGIRLILEIQPQKHAADMVRAMGNADLEKRQMFLEYLNLLKQKTVKIEFYINRVQHDPFDATIWDAEWKEFSLRATQILADNLTNDQVFSLITDLAVISAGMILSLLNIEYNEPEQQLYPEGGVQKTLVDRYERKPANRALCLAANGYRCKICGFDFEEKYGEIGHQFIHVHHIEKISSFDGEYYIDPVTDLIPVCPNCHAMLHRTDPPLKPDELRNILLDN